MNHESDISVEVGMPADVTGVGPCWNCVEDRVDMLPMDRPNSMGPADSSDSQTRPVSYLPIGPGTLAERV
jgi:hypothetical protein